VHAEDGFGARNASVHVSLPSRPDNQAQRDQSTLLPGHPSPPSVMRDLSGMIRSSRFRRTCALLLTPSADASFVSVTWASACMWVRRRICCTVKSALETAVASGDLPFEEADGSYHAATRALRKSPVPVNGTRIVGRANAQVSMPWSDHELAKQTSTS
jgi:hypothetical protein